MAEIDRLTVGVGLNSEEFQAGIDRIMQGIEGLRTETTEAAEGMGASFATMGESVVGLALKFGGLFLAVRGIADVVGYFKDLSSELFHLGLNSQYLGQSAAQMSRWEEVAKRAGGSAEDAISSVQSLQSSIFGLEYEGQMSQNLLWLNRLRVAYLDEHGHMLPLGQIAENAAKALQEQFGAGKGAEPARVQAALRIFHGGLAEAIGAGPEQVRKYLDKANRDQKGITDKVIDSQIKTQEALIGLSYTIKSDATKALDRLTPEIIKLIKAIRTDLVPVIDEVITDLLDFLHPGKAITNLFTSKSQGPIDWFSPMSVYEHFGSWLGRMGADVHEAWVSDMKSGRESILSSITIPGQVAARLPKMTSIEMQALKLLHLEAGGDAGDPNWSKAVTIYNEMTPQQASYFVGAALSTGNLPQAQKSAAIVTGHAIPTPHAGRPFAPASRVSGASAGSHVTIHTLNVNAPQAKDANGIAAAMQRAMERKLLAAQADPGMQ